MSEQLTQPQSFFVTRGQSVKGPMTNVKRALNPNTGKMGKTGIPGIFYTSDDFNTTPLPESFVDFARNKKESNGKTALENFLARGILSTTPGIEMQPTISPAIKSELTVSAVSGRITEDA